MPRSAHLHKRCFSWTVIFWSIARACASLLSVSNSVSVSMWNQCCGARAIKKSIQFFKLTSKNLTIFFLSLKHNHNTNKQTKPTDAVRVAEAKPPGLQGVQEGDAEVLLQARFDEAHGHPATAGAVFERIQERQKIQEREKTDGWMRPFNGKCAECVNKNHRPASESNASDDAESRKVKWRCIHKAKKWTECNLIREKFRFWCDWKNPYEKKKLNLIWNAFLQHSVSSIH